MAGLTVLGISLLLQAAAAALAIMLVRETKRRLAWGLVAAAFVLMFSFRAAHFYGAAFAGAPLPYDLDIAFLELFISAAFAAGMFGVRNFLRSLQRETERIERNEASLAEAQQIARVGNWEWDLATNAVWWSDEQYRLFGFAPGEIQPTFERAIQCVHPDDRELLERQLDTALCTGQAYDGEFRVQWSDGTVRTMHGHGNVIYDGLGVPVRMRGTVQDITERKRAEALATRFGRIIETSTNEIFMFDSQTLRFIQVNRRARENLGYTDAELAEMTPFDVKPALTEADCDALLRPLREGRIDQLTFETVHRRKDGSTYDVEVRLQLSHAETPPVFFAIVEDITERKRAATALRQKEELFRALIEQAPDMIFLLDDDTTIRFASPSVQRVMGFTPDEIIGHQWFEFIHPDDLSTLRDVQACLARQRNELATAEIRFRHFDGSWCVIHAVLRNLLNDPVVKAIVVNAREITDRVVMEEQLRHAQKMEAIGQLTGGIAHDFNNLLSVMIGNLEVLEDRAAGNPDMQAYVRLATKAAERGALLTERLLAFSRKQSLRPRTVDLNDMIGFMSDMLSRTLGETVTIEIGRSAGPCQCEIDPVQLENAILNIAINARDAMPGGGTLTISTANARLDEDDAAAHADVRPGEYAVISLSDTGGGMPSDVLTHVFEPFFTTKDVGKGTGLGLSMVYGFAKQSGGHVTVDSEVGEGTTVRLYLPRAKQAAGRARKPAKADAALRARGETVLVVEDDADVRALAVRLLGDLGYTVFEAENARDAIKILAQHARMDLILSDMVMPGGMDGRDLAAEAGKIRPGIRVVYMSGYSDTAATRGGRLREDEIILQKPFRREELARRLRDVLDAAEPEPAVRDARGG